MEELRKFSFNDDYVVAVWGVESVPCKSIQDASCLACMRAEEGYSCTVYSRNHCSHDRKDFKAIFRTEPILEV